MVTDLLGLMTGERDGTTLVRTLLRVEIFPDADELAGDMCRLDFGLAVVDADALGAAAVPDPGAIPDQFQWVMRDSRLVVQPTQQFSNDGQIVRCNYDLRSQRKFSGTDELVLIFNNVLVIAALLGSCGYPEILA